MAHTKIPANTQPICHMAHQLPFGAYPLEEHDELQLEKHNGINGGATPSCICLLHKLADKREIKCSFQMPIEVICWY
jgi:hypothetical protein